MKMALSSISRANVRFLLPLSLPDTYKTIVKEAISMTGADEGMIFLEHKGILQNVYGSSNLSASVKPRKRGFAYRAFVKREIFVLSRDDFKNVDPVGAKAGIRSILFVPLYYRKSVLGDLILRSRKKNEVFGSSEIHTLKAFGPLASLAIRKAQLYDELRKAIEMRDLFISMAAHEFRTPLTTINGYTQLLAKKISREKHPTEHAWIEQMGREAHRMNLLVNELLELNRIKGGQLSYQWKECSVREILRRAINNFKFAHPDRKLVYKDITHIELDYVIGDFDKLLQVFNNFLDNAAKFSAGDSLITLELSYRYPFFKIQIIDKGKGIPKKDLPNVFDEFYKGHDSHQGLGLGLFLAKNIIVRHKGTIKITSTLGSGTKITVRLPRAKV